MTRKLILALAIAASLAVPASATATVFDGSRSFSAPDTPPALDARPPETQVNPYINAIAATYDDVAGTLTFRVSLFDQPHWGDFLPTVKFSDYDGTVSGWFEAGGPDPADRHRARFQMAGYEGEGNGTMTFDGQTFTITYQHEALSLLDIQGLTMHHDSIDSWSGVEGNTVWLLSAADRRPRKPHTYVANNHTDSAWAEKPTSFWGIYPNNAPLCCGVALHKLRWRNWGKPNAYATAKTKTKDYEPWTRVKVRAYGRTVIYRQGEPTLPDGQPAPYTSYRYKYVKVTFPGNKTVKWTLDFPETE